MKSATKVLAGIVVVASSAVGQSREHAANWRAASPQELAAVLPARAQVIHERIETETNSNTGITDGQAHFVAATVLITAGYAAHGKYSHFLVTQVPLVLGEHLTLATGNYLVGWERDAEGLDVHIYRAESGEEAGRVEAHPSTTNIGVVSVRIWPPRERSVLQIGRFVIPYQLR